MLEAGGRFGAFWNFGDPPVELRERLAPIYHRLAPGLENYSVLLDAERGGARIEDTIAGIVDSRRFGPVEVRRFPWCKTYGPFEWTDHLKTHSDHQGLPPAEREQLLEAVRGAVEAVGGSF